MIAAASSAALIGIMAFGTPAQATVQPPCLTDTCPTASPTPTPTDTSTPDVVYPTEQPPQSTEQGTPIPTDPSVDMSEPAPSPTDTGEQPQHTVCDAGWTNTPTSGWGIGQYRIGPILEVHNGTSSTYPVDFTESYSGTVGLTFTGNFEASAGVFLASVKSTLGISLSASITVSAGATAHPPVHPGHTLYGSYGVYRDKINGHSTYIYSNCTTNTHYWTGYGPYGLGWDTWER